MGLQFARISEFLFYANYQPIKKEIQKIDKKEDKVSGF
jgi:hypothetical protein